MNEQKPNQLWIFKKNPEYDRLSPQLRGTQHIYNFYKRIVLKDYEAFHKVCMHYHFKL